MKTIGELIQSFVEDSGFTVASHIDILRKNLDLAEQDYLPIELVAVNESELHDKIVDAIGDGQVPDQFPAAARRAVVTFFGDVCGCCCGSPVLVTLLDKNNAFVATYVGDCG